MSITLQKKLVSVLFASLVFLGPGMVTAALMGIKLDQAFVGSMVFGLMVGFFEEFYVQGRYGRWLRRMHPLKSLLIYGAIIVGLMLVVVFLNHLWFGRLDELRAAYVRLEVLAPVMLGTSIVAITVIRVVGFIGGKNLFYLMIGKYHRPISEERVFLFLDIKGSTAMVEELGPIRARELIGKVFFDISKPITDNGGEIYRFTGDGLVATWSWPVATAQDNIVKAVDGILGVVKRETAMYQENFGRVPEFRIGVHGGTIVTSEEGDTKKAIGFYGETIHIAARLEQMGKELGVDCLFSEDVASRLAGVKNRLIPVGAEPIRGISRRLGIFELKPST